MSSRVIIAVLSATGSLHFTPDGPGLGIMGLGQEPFGEVDSLLELRDPVLQGIHLGQSRLHLLQVRPEGRIAAPLPFQPPGQGTHYRPQDDNRGGQRGDDDEEHDGRSTVVQEDQVWIKWRSGRCGRHRRHALDDHRVPSPFPSSWRSWVLDRSRSAKSTRSCSSATSCRRASISASSSGSCAGGTRPRIRSAKALPTGLIESRNRVPPPNRKVIANRPSTKSILRLARDGALPLLRTGRHPSLFHNETSIFSG